LLKGESVKLLDTTLLSNFAQIKQLHLLAIALPDALTTPQVLAELHQGEVIGDYRKVIGVGSLLSHYLLMS
jgi:hypothetical protein